VLPDHVLSDQPLPSQFRYPRNIPRQPLIDYEYGGIALNDSSRGLRAKVWRGDYIEDQVVLSAEGVAPTAVLSMPNLRDFSFTFDQNMRVAIAYVRYDGVAAFYWFDATIPGYTTLNLQGAITPRCAMDDNRDTQTSRADIILAYMRSGSLYFREQRDRYQIERFLSDEGGEGGLIQIGMNRNWRFQFQFSNSSLT